MSGLFKTTSLSESENNFFQRFLNMHANLIEFFMHFRSAIDAQRHTHNLESCNDVKTFPELVTMLPIEKHAAEFYTFAKFKEVQTEIVAGLNSCCMMMMNTVADTTIFEVDDTIDGKFNLVYKKSDSSITCGCKLFCRKGLLCRHIFFVLKNLRVESIPDRYLLHRWSKNACFEDGFISIGHNPQAESRRDKRELYYESYKCIGLVEGNERMMSDLLQDLKELTEKYSSLRLTESVGRGKKNLVEDFYGCSIPKSVTVFPPSPVKTKGSGSRIQSKKEAAIRKANKPKRKCSKCKKLTNHDARNCDQVVSVDE